MICEDQKILSQVCKTNDRFRILLTQLRRECRSSRRHFFQKFEHSVIHLWQICHFAIRSSLGTLWLIANALKIKIAKSPTKMSVWERSNHWQSNNAMERDFGKKSYDYCTQCEPCFTLINLTQRKKVNGQTCSIPQHGLQEFKWLWLRLRRWRRQ